MFGRLVLAAALALAAQTAKADTITLRADEWCPYNCAEESDKPGYGIEIAREVFSKAGHVLDYKTMAWARALEECAKGSIMAVIGAARSEAPELVFPHENFAVIDNTFVVRKGDPWHYAGPASLEQVKLGMIRGYNYEGEVGEYVAANLKNRKRIDFVGGDNALVQNLKKLAAGRVGAVADAKPVLAYKIMALGLGDKLAYAGSVDPSGIYIAFSPANPKSAEYAQLLDHGIAEMRASGRLKQILDRYGVSDWK